MCIKQAGKVVNIVLIVYFNTGATDFFFLPSHGKEKGRGEKERVMINLLYLFVFFFYSTLLYDTSE